MPPGRLCYKATVSADPFHLNRPVHLARRDVFYAKAFERIRQLAALKPLDEQKKTAEEALYLLREARRHAEAANLSEKTSDQTRLFVGFMDVVVDNTLSITRMIRRQSGAQSPDNACDRFLNSAGAGPKMAEIYRRCAAQILKGLLYSMQKAQTPFTDLQQTSLAKMSAVDKTRYEKARRHFEERAGHEAQRAAGFPG